MKNTTVTTNDVLKMLVEIINESIDDVQLGVNLNDLEGWDSMAVLLLMAEFDERFGITLDEEKINSLKMVDDILAVLKESNLLSEA